MWFRDAACSATACRSIESIRLVRADYDGVVDVDVAGKDDGAGPES